MTLNDRISSMVIAGLIFSNTVLAESLVSYQLSYENAENNKSSVYYFEDDTELWQHQLDVEVNEGPMVLQVEGLATQTELGDDSDQADQIAIKQGWIDHSLGNLDFSIGKKYLAWDVGYSTRPLDLYGVEGDYNFSHGAELLQMELFGATTSYSLVCGEPLGNEHPLITEDELCTGKIYRLVGSTEWQALLTQQHQNTGAGASFSTVIGQSLELHGSGLWVQKAEVEWLGSYEEDEVIKFNPTRITTRENPGQWLLGFNWSHSTGLGLLLEWHHDDTAPSAKQWRQMIETAEIQRQALVSNPESTGLLLTNLGAGASQLRHPSLIRDRLISRLSLSLDEVELAVALVQLPPDHGMIINSELEYLGFDSFNLSLEWTGFSGDKESLAKQIPENQSVQARLQWHF